MESIMLRQINTLGCFKKRLNRTVYTGKTIAVTTEERDIIFEKVNTLSQVIANKPNINLRPLIFMAKPNKTPNVVATPLPPLNFKNTVQLWPQIQHKPNTMLSISV